VRFAGNRFDRPELAGAFGDLGTLVPFVVGYITIARLDPQGVLLGFGLLALGTGFYFRTPMSVQPMKAIATVAVTQPQLVTPGAIFASAVVTGLFWLGMGISGAVSWLAALTSHPVVRGIVLGLGLSGGLRAARKRDHGRHSELHRLDPRPSDKRSGGGASLTRTIGLLHERKPPRL
jgi:hypothetical protein